MNDLLIDVKNLSNNILSSTVYTNYIKSYEQLVLHNKIYAKVCEFRNYQMNDRLSEMDNYQIPFNREEHLSKLYSDLTLNKIANDFFEKEKAFLDFYTTIMEELTKNLKIDFFELDNL